MVPSDLISSLALRGHAPHRALQPIAPGAPPVSSPTGVFTTRRINAFRHAACCYRSGPVARNGLSLACNSCSFSEPPSQGQRSRPATSRPRRLVALPVRISAPSPLPVRPGKRRLRRVNPVAALPRGANGCSCGLHSPSGLLRPSGSKRSTASAATRPAFRLRPISSRSPKPVLFLGSASDHRSRFATFPEACCSSNLLEPHSICSQSSFPSTLLCVRKPFFNKI